VPFSLIEVEQHFRSAYYLQHQGNRLMFPRQYTPLKHQPTSLRLHSAISQKAVIFILATVRTPNLTFYIRCSLYFHASTSELTDVDDSINNAIDVVKSIHQPGVRKTQSSV
jgi:hypothetical protein